MALYGSTIPTDHGEFVVTIICPNVYAQQKLMQACAGIVPEAGTTVPVADDGHGNTAAPPSLAEIAAAQMRAHDAMKDDDEGEPYDVSADRAFAVGGSD